MKTLFPLSHLNSSGGRFMRMSRDGENVPMGRLLQSAIGAVFIISGLAKGIDIDFIRSHVLSYELFDSVFLAGLTAYVVVAAEIVIGLALPVGLMLRGWTPPITFVALLLFHRDPGLRPE